MTNDQNDEEQFLEAYILFASGQNEPEIRETLRNRHPDFSPSLKTIEKCGGSEYLWDSWCDYIAALYPKKFKNGEHVSQCHVDYLISRKD